jgi:hypothetical protein
VREATRRHLDLSERRAVTKERERESQRTQQQPNLRETLEANTKSERSVQKNKKEEEHVQRMRGHAKKLTKSTSNGKNTKRTERERSVRSQKKGRGKQSEGREHDGCDILLQDNNRDQDLTRRRARRK